MAYNDIEPVRLDGVVGKSYVYCDENEATHWLIKVGFDGNSGELVLPSRQAAEACMQAFVRPYEQGKI